MKNSELPSALKGLLEESDKLAISREEEIKNQLLVFQSQLRSAEKKYVKTLQHKYPIYTPVVDQLKKLSCDVELRVKSSLDKYKFRGLEYNKVASLIGDFLNSMGCFVRNFFSAIECFCRYLSRLNDAIKALSISNKGIKAAFVKCQCKHVNMLTSYIDAVECVVSGYFTEELADTSRTYAPLQNMLSIVDAILGSKKKLESVAGTDSKFLKGNEVKSRLLASGLGEKVFVSECKNILITLHWASAPYDEQPVNVASSAEANDVYALQFRCIAASPASKRNDAPASPMPIPVAVNVLENPSKATRLFPNSPIVGEDQPGLNLFQDESIFPFSM